MFTALSPANSRCAKTGPRGQRGFTLVAALIATALIGIGLATTGEVWSRTKQREMERELLFVGNQFRQAIADYYERSPGGAKQYPQTLEDLLQDRRYATTQRYLRLTFTGNTGWPAGQLSEFEIHSS